MEVEFLLSVSYHNSFAYVLVVFCCELESIESFVSLMNEEGKINFEGLKELYGLLHITLKYLFFFTLLRLDIKRILIHFQEIITCWKK